MPLFGDVQDIFTIKNDTYYNDRLYPLQDRVLALVFSEFTDFYLTGGTALNRFILPLSDNKLPRHSDDLDFFINLDASQDSLEHFHHAKELLLARISEHFTVEAEKNLTLFSEYKAFSDSSFIYFVYHEGVKLKLQFVLDYRRKSDPKLLIEDGYRIDNLNNILTNKIATLKYREEFKDFVDIYNMAKFDSSIEWELLVEQTAKTTKVIGLECREFKEICQNLLSLYRETDMNILTKRVIFGSSKSYQVEQVNRVLNGFDRLVIRQI